MAWKRSGVQFPLAPPRGLHLSRANRAPKSWSLSSETRISVFVPSVRSPDCSWIAKKPPVGGRLCVESVFGHGVLNPMPGCQCFLAHAVPGGAFAPVSATNTSAYFTTPTFLGRPRFLTGAAGVRFANARASRKFALATENATSIPVLTNPRTRIVPRRRFSQASFLMLPKNPSTRDRRDMEENHAAEPCKSRCDSGASVAWKVVYFFEQIDPGAALFGANTAGKDRG